MQRLAPLRATVAVLNTFEQQNHKHFVLFSPSFNPRSVMFWLLVLAFICIPLAELYLLITVGSQIGALPTIAIVIITGLTGAWLARMEGLATMLRVQQSLNQGTVPAEELMDAFIILAAGLVLLTPGFLTDIAGILLLIPFTRNAFKRWLRRRFDAWARKGRVTIHRF